MQENIYDILTKHFFNQTTVEEEQVIEKYKAGNPQEYLKLKEFFEYKSISIKDFDSKKAWQNVLYNYSSRIAPESKTIRVYPRFSKLLAAAVVLIGLLVGAYFYIGNTFRHDGTLLHATGNENTLRKVELNDGSVVWLNDNAKLSYPEKFTGEHRTVTLTGEAFFEIVKDPNKPFIVTTKHADIRVLGTSFNVNSFAEKTEVSVATGTVRVQSNTIDRYVTINAGHSAKASKEYVVAYETSNRNYNSWKTGVFTFKQTSLKAVVKDLNTFYNNKITLSLNVRNDCGLTANFDNAPLQNVIEVLKLTCNLSVKETKEGYVINDSTQSGN